MKVCGVGYLQQIPSGLESIESESDAVLFTSSTETLSTLSSLNTSVEQDNKLACKDGEKLKDSTCKSEKKCLECYLLITRKEIWKKRYQ